MVTFIDKDYRNMTIVEGLLAHRVLEGITSYQVKDNCAMIELKSGRVVHVLFNERYDEDMIESINTFMNSDETMHLTVKVDKIVSV